MMRERKEKEEEEEEEEEEGGWEEITSRNNCRGRKKTEDGVGRSEN